MILTITMNPSVDISYPLEQFKLDTVNRVAKTHKTPGGKGLNVTRVLSQLGDDRCPRGAFPEIEMKPAHVSRPFPSRCREDHPTPGLFYDTDMIDHRGKIARTESVVDIHHGNPACAGIEHREQGSHAPERCPVAHTRGNGDHRA